MTRSNEKRVGDFASDALDNRTSNDGVPRKRFLATLSYAWIWLVLWIVWTAFLTWVAWRVAFENP
ncbi:MAG: hypothetical protein SGI77_07785 [Pirellulaceae bacterium]|nr:hypothetical protein [Pirellulaceae bacterium]